MPADRCCPAPACSSSSSSSACLPVPPLLPIEPVKICKTDCATSSSSSDCSSECNPCCKPVANVVTVVSSDPNIVFQLPYIPAGAVGLTKQNYCHPLPVHSVSSSVSSSSSSSGCANARIAPSRQVAPKKKAVTTVRSQKRTSPVRNARPARQRAL